METIRNYLETMFANLPHSAAVLRAKRELGQMMEDKYAELIAEGKSENEAVGTVIAEFGNLDELAADLGLREEVAEEHALMESAPRRSVGLDEAKDFLRAEAARALGIALGVALCILSVTLPILMDGMGLNGSFGALLMMLLILVAVAILIVTVVMSRPWRYMKKEPCSIDYATAHYVHNERERYRISYAVQLTVGIILCAACWLPAAFFSQAPDVERYRMLNAFGAVFLFVLVSVGVFLIIHTSIVMGAYDTLLKLNDRETVSGRYVPEQQERFASPVVEGLMSVYWPTVRCIYLIWSFLTFAWWETWIIWPIAAVVHAVCKGVMRRRDAAME